VYDGEQHRSEMYRYPVTHSEGFEFRGYCRSFDNKYWNKAAVVDRPSINEPFHADEFSTIDDHARRPAKVPITGAYTLVDWSFDEHYLRKHLHEEDIEPGTPESEEARERARREFAVDVARRIVRPNIEALVDRGAQWIQIDEPAVTTHPDEVDIFVEAFNESVKGLTDQARFSTHICFSDYTKLFPEVLELEGCSEFAVELANRDPWERGTDRGTRQGYHLLDPFAEHDIDAAIGLGVTDIHTDEIEPPELVADRIRYALEVFDDDPTKVWPCTDCGLRTRTWDIAHTKMQRVAEGTQRVRKELALD
jgi:5-methyltetrahydropteroyltriglutamate--homocysteine methyltransferase